MNDDIIAAVIHLFFSLFAVKDRGHVIAIVIGVLCAAVAVVVVLWCLHKRTSSEGSLVTCLKFPSSKNVFQPFCVLFVGRSGSMKKSARVRGSCSLFF